MAGVINQARMIETTPPGKGLSPPFGALYHTTESAPAEIIDIPIMAPTIVCVVDTGSSKNVARANQIPAERRAHNIPYMSNSGEYVYASGFAIPLLIVEVTPDPCNYMYACEMIA